MKAAYDRFLMRLMKYRKSMNLKQSEICELMGITQSHYSKIEQRKKIISNESLKKLAENGVDIDFLFTGIRTEKTILDELLDQCPSLQKDKFLNLIVLYMNVAITSKRLGNALGCTRELEILRFECMDKIDERHESIWNCIRRISGLSQEKLAKTLEIDIKSYREIEKERTMPNAELLAIMYEVYGYYPSLFMKSQSNYLFTINHIWCKLPADVQVCITEQLKRDLEFILSMQI